jgi:hypothetical protein
MTLCRLLRSRCAIMNGRSWELVRLTPRTAIGRSLPSASREPIEQLCACLNDPGRRCVSTAITARLDHDTLFPVELMLAHPFLEIERRREAYTGSEVSTVSIYSYFPQAVGEFVRWKRLQWSLGTRRSDRNFLFSHCRRRRCHTWRRPMLRSLRAAAWRLTVLA